MISILEDRTNHDYLAKMLGVTHESFCKVKNIKATITKVGLYWHLDTQSKTNDKPG